MNTASPKESVLVKCWIFEYVDFRTVTIFFSCNIPILPNVEGLLLLLKNKNKRTLIAKKNWQQMCKPRFNIELAPTGFLDQLGLLHILFLFILIRIRSPASISIKHIFSLCIDVTSEDLYLWIAMTYLLPLFLMKSALLHKAYSITCASIKSINNKTSTPSP